LNVEGRRAAGLGADFIEHLNVFSQSKGRTPTVFVFNPLAEARLAGGKGFSPTKHQSQLVRDLTNLPQFLCRQDDIVIVKQRPSVHFLSGLKEAGFVLPEFVEFDWSAGLRLGSAPPKPPKRADQEIGAPTTASHAAGSAGVPPASLESTGATRRRDDGAPSDPPDSLAQRKLGGLRPWAWGPDSLALFQPLFANVPANQRPAERCFNERVAALYSKAWSADFLRRFLQSYRSSQREEAHASTSQSLLTSAARDFFCPPDVVGLAVNSVGAALEAIGAIRARGHHKVVLKESVGVAGSNALRLFEPELTENQKRWIANVVVAGRQIVVEPWLDRELDFSVQLEMTRDGLHVCGYTGLLNDAKGQFLGNWAEPKHDRKLPAAVLGLLNVLPVAGNMIQQFYAEVFAALEVELRCADFLGPIGIDAFVYRAGPGELRLKPLVEINPRYTMGRVTVELMKHASQGSFGLFRLMNRAQLRRSGFEDFVAYDRRLRDQCPLRFSGDPARRIAEGAVCLNDPAQAQVCLATFQVFRNAAELQRCAGLPTAGLVKDSR